MSKKSLYAWVMAGMDSSITWQMRRNRCKTRRRSAPCLQIIQHFQEPNRLLLAVGRWLTPLGKTKSRLARIGWTKLSILADYSGPLSRRSLLAHAEKHTAAELPAILKAGPSAK